MYVAKATVSVCSNQCSHTLSTACKGFEGGMFHGYIASQ